MMKHSVMKMKARAVAWLMAAGALGCSGGTDPEPQANACSAVTVEGESYCVWRQQGIIIETGYVCPQDLSYRH